MYIGGAPADVAGRDVTEYMQTLLRKSGYVFHTSAEKEVVRLIKEAVSYVAPDPKKEEKDWAAARADQSKTAEYVLPDGARLRVGQERFRAPEILFDPELIGLEYPGIQQIVTDAINRTDLDLRKALYANIVLSGGSTLTKGFGDRLLGEVKRLAVKDMRIKIFAPPERKYSTWIGGSILAGLSTFRKVCRIFFDSMLFYSISPCASCLRRASSFYFYFLLTISLFLSPPSRCGSV